MPTVSEISAAVMDDRPECWSINGLYMGATPVPLRQVMPLVEFPEDDRYLIGETVLAPRPPDEWREVLGGVIPSRGYHEWFWYRRADPYAVRKPIPAWMRRAVIERDGHVCQLCGLDVDPTDIHIDHIVPVSLAGPTEVDNLQVAHSICNLRKGNRI